MWVKPPTKNLDEPTMTDNVEVNWQYAVISQSSNPLTDSASEVKGHNHDVDLGHSATEVQESVLCVSDAIGETSQGVEDNGVLAEPDQISIVASTSSFTRCRREQCPPLASGTGDQKVCLCGYQVQVNLMIKQELMS